jgi:hypothetical protein
MKGIIFNIAEKFIIDTYGEDTFDEIMLTCSLQTREPFVGPGTYPSTDLMEILQKSSVHLNVPLPLFMFEFGKFSFTQLADRYPSFIESHDHPKEFLKSVEGVIHVEVKKLYSNVELPTFYYSEPSPNELVITYYSRRRLFDFMEGLIEGVALHYEKTIRQSRNIYEKNGHVYCDFNLKFA